VSEDESIDFGFVPANRRCEGRLAGGVAKHAGEVEAAPLRIKCCEAGVIWAAQGKDGVGRLAEFGCAAIGDDTKRREGRDGDEDFAPIV